MGEEKRWRLRIDGRETSGVNRVVIESLIRRGDVLPSTPVCEEGTALWREAALVPEFSEMFGVPVLIRRAAVMPRLVDDVQTPRTLRGRWRALSMTAKAAAVLICFGTLFPTATLVALWCFGKFFAPDGVVNLVWLPMLAFAAFGLAFLSWVLLFVLGAVFVARLAWGDARRRDNGGRHQGDSS